ncbi:MAG: ParB/RepB/Spo0J family partition protein [Amaricoccus sp.]|uniref:ParB/RepB/Spo0J family partition protein n=1 Tax=Amaricoccus sp. TaxID=1872485 RepID=UPI0033157CF5
MATAVQKIRLSSSRDIPFDKLVLSQANVRRVKAGVSVEELAESIARRGLIQSLHVRPVLDADGKETGTYEVPAGGRRFRALELLVKQKRLARTAPVPCVVSEAGSEVLIDEVSLAENIERAPLHPLDQFRAFQALREKGMTEEAIAAAFFVGAQVVKQRLRLAAVSPILLDVYAEDGMTLEQLMAFTVSADHERQERVWQTLGSGWSKEPWQIRRMLTETTVRASDRRAVFVGVEAYEAAGGVVLRDLFQSDDGGWLQDAGLLDRLVAEKLTAAAEAVAAEGWKWVEAAVSLPYGATFELRTLDGVPIEMTEAEVAARDALQVEFNQLNEAWDSVDELPDEVDHRLGEIEDALEAMAERPLRFEPAEVARAGAFLSLAGDGRLVVDRGYVRAEDEPAAEVAGDDAGNDGAGADDAESSSPMPQRAVITVGGQPTEPEPEEEDEGIRPLPERLVIELTAHRTLALRDAVAGNPRVALTALLHELVSGGILRRSGPGCLEASVRQVFFPAQADDLGESASARSVAEREARWKEAAPAEDEALWDWLAGLDDAARMELLAHCVSAGINALHEQPNPYGGAGVSASGLQRRLAGADRLARATGLDMVAAGWRPTVGNYLGRVTKARIIEAVREGAGAQAAQLIDHLKKGEMAKEAERLLADRGWLPEPLRRAGDGATGDGEADAAVLALPAFLADDEDGDDDEDVDGASEAFAAE